MTTVVSYAELASTAGTDLGWSDWLEMSQERVQLFADATGDQQWIHVDPERAAGGPFGAPIAHGFLTLSLNIKFWSELFVVTGVTTKVNYGLDKVRFISPVTVGSNVRGRAIVADVKEIAGGWEFHVDQTIEIEGGDRPALVARCIYRFYA